MFFQNIFGEIPIVFDLHTKPLKAFLMKQFALGLMSTEVQCVAYLVIGHFGCAMVNEPNFWPCFSKGLLQWWLMIYANLILQVIMTMVFVLYKDLFNFIISSSLSSSQEIDPVQFWLHVGIYSWSLCNQLCGNLDLFRFSVCVWEWASPQFFFVLVYVISSETDNRN